MKKVLDYESIFWYSNSVRKSKREEANMAKKMTRKEALNTLIEIAEEWKAQNFATDEFAGGHTSEAIAVARKMIESIDKQSNRPKSKSSARIQNENSARLLIEKLRAMDDPKPFNATWIAENIPYVMTSQRGYHVAKIAIEWGALEEITIKKRTFYQFVETWEPSE